MFVEPGLRHDGYGTGLSEKRSDAEPGGLQQNKISGKGIVMKRQIEEQKGRILWIIINISVFCLVLLLTYITPYYADDLMNKKIFGTETDIQNVGDVAESVKFYYTSWGGRASAQFLIQFFLLFDKRLFDIVNAFVYVAVAYVIYKYIEPDKKRNNVLLLFIHFMLWFFMPTFGGEAVWLTGSITYLWELLIVLSFGLVYYHVCVAEEKGGGSAGRRPALPAALGMAIAGFFAGLSIEAASCTLLAALFFFAVWSVRQKRRFRGWEITGMLGALAGFCVLMLAPGNFSRYSYVAGNDVQRSIFLEYMYRIFRETYYAFYYLTLPAGVCIALILLAPKTLKKRILLFPGLAFVSVYVMTFSNGFATRVFLTPLVLLTIGIGLAAESIIPEIKDMGQNEKKWKRSFTVVVCTLALVALTQYGTGVLKSIQTGEVMHREISYILHDTSVSQGIMP